MKKILTAAVGVAALLSATTSFAGTHGPSTYGTTNAAPHPNWLVNAFNGNGLTAMPDDSDTASPTVVRTFTLNGTVNKDCSYYTGGSANQTISLGTIGVRNGDFEDVGTLYNQVADLGADIQSTGAGCNTNNTVTVAKNVNGLVNPTPGGYDSNQFTANIPYKVAVGLTGVPVGTVGAGSFQGFLVDLNQSTNNMQVGAWRSQFNLHLTIPAQSKGLVAGTYSDTITVTLAAN